MKFRLLSMLFIVVVLIGVAHISHAVDISAVFPGQATGGSTATGPGSFIASFYIWALSISGILAFGIIVYGGVKYMVSVGNPSGEGDAKEWIKAAILGILLLAGAYMILNVINPSLTDVGLPALNSANTPGSTQAQTPQVTQGTVWCSQNTDGQCPNTSDGKAQECVDAGNSAGHDYSCQPTKTTPTYTCGQKNLGYTGSCAPGYMCDPSGDCVKDN